MNKIASNKIPNIGDVIKGTCFWGPAMMKDIIVKVTEIISITMYTYDGCKFIETRVNDDVVITTQIGWRYY